MERRTKAEAQITRQNILNAALDIFSEKNYSVVSVVEIAERAGVTKGAVYWHFNGKSDLVFKIIEESCKQSENEFMGNYNTPKSLLALRNYYKELLNKPLQDDHYKKIHKVMFNSTEWPKDLRSSVQEMVLSSINREVSMLERLIAKGQANNKLRKDLSPHMIASVTAYIFHGLFVLQLAEILPGDFVNYLNFLFDALSHELDIKK